jgi:hypothetical protein
MAAKYPGIGSPAPFRLGAIGSGFMKQKNPQTDDPHRTTTIAMITKSDFMQVNLIIPLNAGKRVVGRSEPSSDRGVMPVNSRGMPLLGISAESLNTTMSGRNDEPDRPFRSSQESFPSGLLQYLFLEYDFLPF